MKIENLGDGVTKYTEANGEYWYSGKGMVASQAMMGHWSVQPMDEPEGGLTHKHIVQFDQESSVLDYLRNLQE